MQIQPINDFVIVAVDDPAETTTSGIIVTKAVKGTQETGIVIAVARKDAEIKPGDKVIFKSYHLEEFEHEKEKVGILLYTDVIGRIDA